MPEPKNLPPGVMYCERTGNNRPPIVLIHGFTCDHTDWHWQIEALQQRYQVIACDLRGHGRTPGTLPECTIEIYGADVAKLLATLNLTGAVLVGHSLGCRVALEAASQQPERIGGLICIDGINPGLDKAALGAQAIRQKIESMGYPAFIEERFATLFPFPRPESTAIIARAKNFPAEIGGMLYPRLLQWDEEKLDPALSSLRLPLMVIQRVSGTFKPANLAASLNRVQRFQPKARVEVVADAGHFIQLEAPEKVNQLIESFIGGLD